MKSDAYSGSIAKSVLITGSYGKTNCIELLRRILEVSGFSVFCAGCAAEVQQLSYRPDFILVHASFTELRQLQFAPDTVVITNISSYPLRHYRRYRDLLRDLYEFFLKLAPGTRLIENHEYRFLNSVFGEAYASLAKDSFFLNGSLEEGVWVSPERTIMMSSEEGVVPVIRLDELFLQGERNLSIYLAAAAAARRYAKLSVIQDVCRSYTGHPGHFCCYPLERNIRLYMQLNTGLPSLVEASFVGFSEKLVIVTGNFGNVSEDQTYQGLALMLSAYAKRLILFGSDRDMIDYAVRKIGVRKAHTELSIMKRETADAAMRYAVDSARNGEWILFAPIDHVSGLSFDRKRCTFLRPSVPCTLPQDIRPVK